jgi:hypothetical protein
VGQVGAMSARLTDRVLRNYAWQEPVGQRSPIEIMSWIYPGMFGSGLSDPARGICGSQRAGRGGPGHSGSSR